MDTSWSTDMKYTACIQISKARQSKAQLHVAVLSIVVLDCKNYEVRGVVDVVVVDAPGVKPFRFFNLLNILLRSRVNLWGWIYGVNKTADKQGKADASSCSNSIVVIG